MRHFPAFLNLENRPALVVGVGPMAERKAEMLHAAGAVVRMRNRFDPADLEGCAVAIGAECPEAELCALSDVAMACGIPVNIVDRPDLCSFITPAIIDRDPVTIAVSTGGAAPVLARLLRQRIEAAIPPGIGRLAALLGVFAGEIRRRFPDFLLRRRVLERMVRGRVADLVYAGEERAARLALMQEIDAGADPDGAVFLIGAGPGDPDLLTIRAHRLLGEADVIVTDRLVSDEVLALARRDAEVIHAGKARGCQSLSQPDINALLIRLAREGKRVVRLKGGDPLIFGRAGEEIAALEAAGIRVEVVPGITAALACAADARVPLTLRDASRAVALVTGHTHRGAAAEEIAGLAKPGVTVASYMAIHALPALSESLAARGFDPATPAMLIENGGSRRRRFLSGTLPELVQRAPAWSTGGPALLLLGEVVGHAALTHSPGSDRREA